MTDRYPEMECYECGRLKTRLIWKSRCVTCVVQKLEINLEENEKLRNELNALDKRVKELEGYTSGPSLAERWDAHFND